MALVDGEWNKEAYCKTQNSGIPPRNSGCVFFDEKDFAAIIMYSKVEMLFKPYCNSKT